MFATLFLPNFYLQAALRHQPEHTSEPVALIDGEATKAVIIELNAAAENVGVTCGMAPSQALARYLELIVGTRVRAQEKLLDELLLQFGFSLSPFVEATAPGVCTVQFTDARNVSVEVERVVGALAEAGIIAQAGIAPTPDASLLAAHLGKPVLQVEDPRGFLAALPLETLKLA